MGVKLTQDRDDEKGMKQKERDKRREAALLPTLKGTA